jgi:hypothetical protein
MRAQIVVLYAGRAAHKQAAPLAGGKPSCLGDDHALRAEDT